MLVDHSRPRSKTMYLTSLSLLITCLTVSAQGKTYPLWLHSQMPDTFHVLAAYNHYDDGFPVAAIEKFTLASRYGNLHSRIKIGLMYMDGDGVEKDLVQAYAWFALAEMTKETPWKGTQSPRQQILELLDQDDRQQAQLLLSELIVEHGPEKVTHRILSWLRREKHKHRESHSLISVAGNTLTRKNFFRQMRSYVVDVYVPETKVKLRELEIIEDTLDQ